MSLSIKMKVIEQICESEERNVTMYGLSCMDTDTEEISVYNSLTSDKKSIDCLMKKCINGEVSFISLNDIIYDFIVEKY